MKYSVVWSSEAERQLTQLWLGSRMRSEIANAANEIDAMLAQNPHECGESRDATRRFVLTYPLGVIIDISDLDRLVRVLSIWSF